MPFSAGPKGVSSGNALLILLKLLVAFALACLFYLTRYYL